MRPKTQYVGRRTSDEKEDSDNKEMPPKGLLNWFVWIPRRIVRGLIVIYQKTLSLDHGPLARFVPYPTCKYHPTCSEYGYTAISRFGIIRGIPMTLWRILRCNPWSEGGFDPVPEKSLNHDSQD